MWKSDRCSRRTEMKKLKIILYALIAVGLVGAMLLVLGKFIAKQDSFILVGAMMVAVVLGVLSIEYIYLLFCTLKVKFKEKGGNK